MEQIKKNIIELLGETKNKYQNDIAKVSIDALCDYNDSSYICDAIAEICDNNIDIYYYDLFEWAKGNFSYIEEANNELGNIDPDITKQIQSGQYYANNEYCNDNLNDMLKIYCLNILKNNDVEEIEEERLDDYIEGLDSNDYLPSYEDIRDAFEEVGY